MEKKKLLKVLLIELLFVILVIAFDQLTKYLIYNRIDASGEDIILIKGVLRFTAVENTGASFGIFKGNVTALAIVSSISILCFLIFGIYSAKIQNKWYRAGLVLVIAGGIGNIIDRFVLKFVRDFVYFELIDFAVFNFADSALTIGSVCLIIFLLFYYDKKDKNSDKTEVSSFSTTTATNHLKIESNHIKEEDRLKNDTNDNYTNNDITPPKNEANK